MLKKKYQDYQTNPSGKDPGLWSTGNKQIKYTFFCSFHIQIQKLAKNKVLLAVIVTKYYTSKFHVKKQSKLEPLLMLTGLTDYLQGQPKVRGVEL